MGAVGAANCGKMVGAKSASRSIISVLSAEPRNRRRRTSTAPRAERLPYKHGRWAIQIGSSFQPVEPVEQKKNVISLLYARHAETLIDRTGGQPIR